MVVFFFFELESYYFPNGFFSLSDIFIIFLFLFSFRDTTILRYRGNLHNNMTLSTILRAGNSWLSGSETIHTLLNDFLETIRYFICVEFWILLELLLHVYTIIKFYSSIEIESKFIFPMRYAFRKRDPKM